MQIFNHFPLIMIMTPMIMSMAVLIVKKEQYVRLMTLAMQTLISLLSLWLLISLINSEVEAFAYTMG